MDNHRNGMTAEEIRDLVGESPTMLEIGSHAGIDTVKFLAAMPEAHIHCFEPDPRPIERFERAVGNDPRVTLIPMAVSDRDGYATLYRSSGSPPGKKWKGVTDWDYSSSIYRPTGHRKTHRWCTFPAKHQLKIWTTRLDTWLAARDDIEVVDFIWADTQGAEAAMILGATETLKRTRWLYTEFYDTPQYEGQPNLAMIDALLPGWELVATYEGYNALFKHEV